MAENSPSSSAGQTKTRRHAPHPPSVTTNKPSSNSVSMMRWDPAHTRTHTRTRTRTHTRTNTHTGQGKVDMSCCQTQRTHWEFIKEGLGCTGTKCTQVSIWQHGTPYSVASCWGSLRARVCAGGTGTAGEEVWRRSRGSAVCTNEACRPAGPSPARSRSGRGWGKKWVGLGSPEDLRLWKSLHVLWLYELAFGTDWREVHRLLSLEKWNQELVPMN